MTSNNLYVNQRKGETRRRRREKTAIFSLVPLFILLTYLEIHFSEVSQKIPFVNKVFFFGLINFNVVLIGLLFFLVFRNIVKLFWERKSGVWGSKLKTKLVMVFVGFTLIPTLVLSVLSAFYITGTLNKWFNQQVGSALGTAVEVSDIYYQREREKNFHFANIVGEFISSERLLRQAKVEFLKKTVRSYQTLFGIDAIEIYLPEKMRPNYLWLSGEHERLLLPVLEGEYLREVFEGRPSSGIRHVGHGDFIFCAVPIYEGKGKARVVGGLVISSFIPQNLMNKFSGIHSMYTTYHGISPLKHSLKSIYFIMIVLMALLILFASLWFSFHIAREITIPIHNLAEGTMQIARGNLDVHIESLGNDEMAALVSSFNRMAVDLKESSSQLEKANSDLQKTSMEREEKRQYLEAVLKNVTAGVVSMDADGYVSTLNRSAEDLLGVRAGDILGRQFRTLLTGTSYLEIVEDLMREISLTRSLRRQMTITLGERVLTLLVNMTTLIDEKENFGGTVIVFDDVTEMIQAQRSMAWQEVARRIAHEIKNPLTPIKLSAQRLRKRFQGEIRENYDVFDECTKIIIKQVDELKNLVNEFSAFARMPAAKPMPSRLQDVINEAITLYQEAHPQIHFSFESPVLPSMRFDRDQVKRIFINLLDNAVSAIKGVGIISIKCHYDKDLHLVTTEVSDTGVGIDESLIDRLFEPDFSTKEGGTGLGLAIVQRIVSDHNGRIRVAKNKPRGAKFFIELPVDYGQVHTHS